MNPVRSPAELYSHAIALEREATLRYRELAERMDEEGREDLAHVFAALAQAEGEHLEALERRTEGVALAAELRALAREMAAEEREHAALLNRMLESTPAPLGAALVFAKE